ncbi:MAG: hypothetical protein Q9M94_02365 [Candidatus Gracilibacteria bacterium]|nr:hypothetical protein [Candidatus Gracilibacteria bacterium]
MNKLKNITFNIEQDFSKIIFYTEKCKEYINSLIQLGNTDLPEGEELKNIIRDYYIKNEKYYIIPDSAEVL